MNLEQKRESMQFLKNKFLKWRDPPVELPPDSIIDEVIDFILEDGALWAIEKIRAEIEISIPDHNPVKQTLKNILNNLIKEK